MAYKYYNSNPQDYKLPDCVIRAISTAMNISYYDVVYFLKQNGKYYQCDELNVRCYEKLLDDDFNLPHYQGWGKRVKDLSKEFCKDILIIRIEGHLTVSVYGDVLDIWNCSNEIATDYWICT